MTEDVLTIEDLQKAMAYMKARHYRRPEAIEMSSDVMADMKLRHGPLCEAGETGDRLLGLPVRVVGGRNILRPVYGVVLVRDL